MVTAMPEVCPPLLHFFEEETWRETALAFRWTQLGGAEVMGMEIAVQRSSLVESGSVNEMGKPLLLSCCPSPHH